LSSSPVLVRSEKNCSLICDSEISTLHRTSMFALVLLKFLDKEHLVKCRLSCNLIKIIFTSQEHFKGVYIHKDLSSLHKIGWRSAERISPFLQYASSM
jgi:hypothetical protein